MTEIRATLAETTIGYPVTPGDQFVLSFITAIDTVSNTAIVEVDYTLNLGIFGKINVRGFTLQQLRAEVGNLVNNAYPGSFPQLKLLQTGSFTVTVRWEVDSTYQPSAWGLTRLSEILEGALRRTRHTVTLKSSQRGATGYHTIFLEHKDLAISPIIPISNQATLFRFPKQADE